MTVSPHAWRAERLRDIARLHDRLLEDLIPGPPVAVAWRHPTEAEKDATDRPDGKFTPTPHATPSRPGGTHSDPTAAQVLTAEQRAQQTVTTIWQAVTTIDHAGGISTPPLPAGIVTRLTSTGREVIDHHPDACRALVTRCCRWLAHVVDLHMRDIEQLPTYELADAREGEGRIIEREILRATPRTPDPATTIVVCERCGYRPMKYRGIKLCAACYQDDWRERQKNAS